MKKWISRWSGIPPILLVALAYLPAQTVDLVATRWSDSFREWVLYAEEEEVGSLELKWLDGGDWTEYRINWFGLYGQTRLALPGRLDQWEVRLGQETIILQAIYPGDPTQWRVIGPELQISFQARYPEQREEWQLREDTYGQYRLYTAWQGDPREWIIEDSLTDERISQGMRAAMVFIALIQSTPNR